MFDTLSDRLGSVFDKLKGRGALSEQDVRDAMREVRIALLEADVALPVVRRFVEAVTEKAIGQDVLKSVTPGHRQRYVRFEQRNAYLAHGLAHVVLGKRAAPAELVEDGAEPVGQGVEHRSCSFSADRERTGETRKTPADENSSASEAPIGAGKTGNLVEPSGIEPLTSTLPVLRSPS